MASRRRHPEDGIKHKIMKNNIWPEEAKTRTRKWWQRPVLEFELELKKCLAPTTANNKTGWIVRQLQSNIPRDQRHDDSN
jgi:hypothetical protein